MMRPKQSCIAALLFAIAAFAIANVKVEESKARNTLSPDTGTESLTEKFNKIYARMYAGMVCDTLVEDVYRELEKDTKKVELAHRVSQPGSRNIEMNMAANVTVDRMLRPTKEKPGSTMWEGG